MTLSTYLERPDAIRATQLAGMIGVSKSRIAQLRDSTDWPPALALAVERATKGEVDAADLSPIVAEARRTDAQELKAATNQERAA